MDSRDLNVQLIKKQKSHAHCSCVVYDSDTALQEITESFMKLNTLFNKRDRKNECGLAN